MQLINVHYCDDLKVANMMHLWYIYDNRNVMPSQLKYYHTNIGLKLNLFKGKYKISGLVINITAHL